MSDKNIEETLPYPKQGGSAQPPLDETQRIEPQDPTGIEETGPSASTLAPMNKIKRLRTALGVLAGLIVFVGLGVLGGYQAGLSQRRNAEVLERAKEAVIQFQYGEADLAAGKCDIAKQRFEYVIQLNPDFPNLAEKYAESILCSTGNLDGSTAVIEEPTPTPDLRGAEELFSSAEAFFAQQDWTEVMSTLDTLRKNYPDFMPIEGDGMYYISLRQRGYNRIGAGDLEGGIYDLNRAESIGPLDAEAVGYRQAAIWYIIGQSFWDVDWIQAVQYFELVAEGWPSLHDVNFFTAKDRLAEAKENEGKQATLELVREALRQADEDNWCAAYDLFSQAEAYGPLEPDDQAARDEAFDHCFGEPES